MALPSEALQNIHRDIDSLHQHSSVLNIRIACYEKQEASVLLAAIVDFGISLPSRRSTSGVSSTGVKAVEPVEFVFQQNYPLHAPKIYLRHDFPRTFAHIQPGSPESLPVPCIFYGDIDELFHREGLLGITYQLADWLQKAALDRLINPTQGWEPIRRDSLEDIVVADLSLLRSHCGRQAQHFFYSIEYLRLTIDSDEQNGKMTVLSGQIENIPLKFSPNNISPLRQSCSQTPLENSNYGKGLAILATPGKDKSGKPYIASLYEPETVSDVMSLYAQAEKYGCQESLNNAFSWLKDSNKKLNANFKLPLVIILAARRPCNLIGENSNIELIPYWLEIGFPDMLISGEATAVYPLCLIQTASKDLLQTFSNQKLDLGSEGIALVGCGSLGSKIAIHMARSGHAPGRVIDKGYLSPHNAARHALLPETNTMQLGWQRQKANALASAIRSLNQETKEFHADASLVTHNSELRKQLFPNKVRTIINATASVTVREALAQLPTNKLAARVIETSLFANGKLGFLSYEGANRNPNTLDLITFAYQLMHDELDLRELVLEKLEEGQYQSTGQGCGSLTMRIADSLISLHAASMTQGITSLLENFSEGSGCLSLGRLAGDGMSLKWQTYKVSPSQIVQIENAPNWQVRVADHIHQKIIAECAYFPNVETGGVIIGRISYCSQSFLVTDIIPAPKDSERTPDQFILGIQGITEAIAQYEKNSNGTLHCLGTWHSHLYHSDPSGEDYKVAAILAKSRKIPFAMLIHTPGGYKAILADKEYLKDEH